MYDRAATIAATVNGAIVALAPPIVLVMLGAFNDTAVHPPGYSHYVAALAALSPMVVTLSPVAMLAAWRTFVYARRRCDRGDSGWRGVLEAGACGFLLSLMVLSRGIIGSPRSALPYIVVYGSVAVLLGLFFGVVLRTAAVTVLHICGDRA